MKKQMMMVAAAVAVAWSVRGVERIAVDEVVNHYPWDGKVDCVCTVSGLESAFRYKGAFTLSVKKDGGVVCHTVTNDFPAADGVYTNTFDCAAIFGEGLYPNGGIAVDLVRSDDRPDAPIGITGDVLVIDVSGGSEATAYPTEELTEVDLGTFNCDIYKTDKIVLRKIPAGTYVCHPRDWSESDAVATQLLTTKGFYIGVFPVTQQQYERVMGTNPSCFKTDAPGNVAAQRPVEHVSWNKIRGSVAAGTAITASSADSFLKRLVEKTGLSGLDLPTEAQWEMAARKDATAAYGEYWNGNAAVVLTSSTIGEVAWYGDPVSTTHAVGGKRPNVWGLYDMQGNVWEWCRDVYINTYNTAYVDTPCTETSYVSGGYRVIRGGSWSNYASGCRPSIHEQYGANYAYDYYGFRLSKALP